MIAEDKWFYFVSGRKASSIEELRSALETVDDNEFAFHCNSGKNDFANWVEGVFVERDLAKRMREVTARNSMIILLAGFLNENRTIARKGEDAEEEAKDDAKDGIAEDAGASVVTAASAAPAVPAHDHDDKRSETKNETKSKSLKPLSEKELADYFKLEDKQASDGEAEAEVKAKVATLPSFEPSGPAIQAPEPPKDESAAQKEIRMADLDLHNMMMGRKPLSPQAEEHRKAMADIDKARKRLVVKEFIYGFVIGLVFGLIMLGVLFNLKC